MCIRDSESTESTADEAQSQAASNEPKEEYVYVTDDSGQRKKIKVDFTPDKVKKAYEMAAGMRKFQAERDRYKKEVEAVQAIREEYEDLKKSWTTLEETVRTKGVEGVLDLLLNKEGAYQEYLQREFERREFLKNASPAERERFELEERLARAEREKAQKAKEFEEFQNKLLKQKEQQEELELKNLIVPAFSKHRFAGTLGDSVLEERLDQAVWNQALSNLENLPDNIPLSNALVEKEFREVAATFRKAINRQAVAKAKEVVETRKANAQAAVAAKAASGFCLLYTSPSPRDS